MARECEPDSDQQSTALHGRCISCGSARLLVSPSSAMLRITTAAILDSARTFALILLARSKNARRRWRETSPRPLLTQVASAIGFAVDKVEAAGIEPPFDSGVTGEALCDCVNGQHPRAAHALHFSGTSEQSMSLIDATRHGDSNVQLSLIVLAWPYLPEHVRASILLLVKAASCQ